MFYCIWQLTNLNGIYITLSFWVVLKALKFVKASVLCDFAQRPTIASILYGPQWNTLSGLLLCWLLLSKSVSVWQWRYICVLCVQLIARAWSHAKMRSAEIRLLRIHRTSVDFIWRHYQTAGDLDHMHK